MKVVVGLPYALFEQREQRDQPFYTRTILSEALSVYNSWRQKLPRKTYWLHLEQLISKEPRQKPLELPWPTSRSELSRRVHSQRRLVFKAYQPAAKRRRPREHKKAGTSAHTSTAIRYNKVQTASENGTAHAWCASAYMCAALRSAHCTCNCTFFTECFLSSILKIVFFSCSHFRVFATVSAIS